GLQGPDEPALAGWTVYLDLNQSGRLDAGEPFVVTGASGTYSFANLAPGAYTVAELPQAGWGQTLPGSGPYHVTLAGGENRPNLNFGNRVTDPAAANHPPRFTDPGEPSNTEVRVGELFRYPAQVVDVDGDPLTFDLPVHPEGMVVGAGGVVAWVPTAAQQNATHDVLLRVQDDKHAVALKSFRV